MIVEFRCECGRLLKITMDASDVSPPNRPTFKAATTRWLEDRFRESREWETDELRRRAIDDGIPWAAIIYRTDLPIVKRQVSDKVGHREWVWVARPGWPAEEGQP